MSVFFECCVKCKRTFTDEAEYNRHMDGHKASRKVDLQQPVRAIAEAESQGITSPVLTDNVESRLESVKAVNAKRKKLINAGVEAATMTPGEVESRFNAEKEKGRVK